MRELHDQIAGFDDIQRIDDATRQIVEAFMPDLADRLPARRSETFDQAFGRVRGKAQRKAVARARRKRKRSRER